MMTDDHPFFRPKMPFKPVQATKCPKCNKNVYAAEEVLACGTKFHKMCFSCNLCRKMLEATTMAEHQMELYCRTCYARKYGPKGVGFGTGAGTLVCDTGELFGNTDVPFSNIPHLNNFNSKDGWYTLPPGMVTNADRAPRTQLSFNNATSQF